MNVTQQLRWSTSAKTRARRQWGGGGACLGWKAQNWEPCLSISKAAFTPASSSAIWRCKGAGEQEAARRGFCVMESSQVSVLAPVIVNTQINIVSWEGMNPDQAGGHKQSNETSEANGKACKSVALSNKGRDRNGRRQMLVGICKHGFWLLVLPNRIFSDLLMKDTDSEHTYYFSSRI